MPNSSKQSIEIYDTTLRDGSQLEGISLTVEDKLRIAEQLDSLGVHYIEGGWPGSNPKDDEFFARAQEELSRILTFFATKRDAVICARLLEGRRSTIEEPRLPVHSDA